MDELSYNFPTYSNTCALTWINPRMENEKEVSKCLKIFHLDWFSFSKLFSFFSLNKGKRYVATSACPVCAKTYVNEGSLRKHIQTAHANVTNNANNASINHDSNQQQQHQQQQHVELVGQLNGDVLNTGSAAALGLLACSVCRQMFTSKDG